MARDWPQPRDPDTGLGLSGDVLILKLGRALEAALRAAAPPAAVKRETLDDALSFLDHAFETKVRVVDAVMKALAARQGPGWQPIETHDKSAGPILVALIRDGKVWRASDASFNGNGYYTVNGGQCHWRTHWMPLPSPRAEGGA